MAKRQFVSFPFSDLYKIKQQVLNWSTRFNTCCFLDNQRYTSSETGYECLVAVGEKARLEASSGTAFKQLKQFSSVQDDWLFGHFSFDLKSETEQSPSDLSDRIQFPDLFFFVPQILLLIEQNEIQIGLIEGNHLEIFNQIIGANTVDVIDNHDPLSIVDTVDVIDNHDPVAFVGTAGVISNRDSVSIKNRISKSDYLQIIQSLQQHIRRGDCYEINFCQEFYAENIEVTPTALYQQLSRLSPSPFSAFYKVDKKYLFCASPERYLRKTGSTIVSQPIKGTSARNLKDPVQDAHAKTALATSEKDRAENVMVVDLVRNDLSKICEIDSVQVDELFGIYSFAQVHQMISTISGKPLAGLHWSEMIRSTFPMGSMTGAPKKRVLELIEQYEQTNRGLFSGALGYVKPNHDFDFNVVIRSILYNSITRYLAYFAGSGITINSDPLEEYEECLLKVAAFEEVIKNH